MIQLKKKGKIMKKGLIIKVISFILIFSCLFTGGCFFNLGYRSNIKALSKIETNEEYTFQQLDKYTYKGKTFSLFNNMRKYKRNLGLKAGNGTAFRETKIVGDYVYALCYYGAYQVDNESYNDAVVLKAHIKKPTEVEPILAIKKFKSYYCYIDVTDNLLILYSRYSIQIYDLNNLKKPTYWNIKQELLFSVTNKYWKYIEHDKKLVVLTKEQSKATNGDITVIDKNLTKYNIPNVTANYFALYNDYLLLNYNNKSVPHTRSVYEYKTGKRVESPRAEEIIKEYLEFNANQPKDNSSSDEEIKEFSFNGNNYTWENVTTTVKRNSNTRDEYGKYSSYSYYTDLIITNVDTQEKYTLNDETFKEVAKEVLNAIGSHVTCKKIYSQNGELYFCYYNLESAWGVISGNTTPSIVFKYNEQSNKLVYIGFGEEAGYPPIVHKGNLIG